MTLTFLPGTMCDRRIWAPVWLELKGRFPVGYIALETERTRAGMRNLIAAAGSAGEALNLVGFSMGGYFALEYALEQPGRIASLVLVSSSAFGLTDAEIAERRKAVAYLETHEYQGIATNRISQFVHPSRLSDPAVADIMRAMDRDLGRETLVAQLKETSERVSLGPRLPELDIPVMLVGAEVDPFAPPLVIDRMAGLIRNVRVAKAANTGHMIPLEQPAWLAARIAEFHS